MLSECFANGEHPARNGIMESGTTKKEQRHISKFDDTPPYFRGCSGVSVYSRFGQYESANSQNSDIQAILGDLSSLVSFIDCVFSLLTVVHGVTCGKDDECSLSKQPVSGPDEGYTRY
jgi:hypothetical protein